MRARRKFGLGRFRRVLPATSPQPYPADLGQFSGHGHAGLVRTRTLASLLTEIPQPVVATDDMESRLDEDAA